MPQTKLPPPNGMTSFWRSSPGSLDDYRSSEALPSECDVLIIGAGYSGASLITHLLAQEESKDKSFVILEARQLCSGATGRNGGHCKPDLYNVPSSAAQKHGIRAGVEIAEFELANLEAVREYVQEEGVDCDFQMTQAVDVQLDEAQNEALRRRYDEFVAKGGKVARRAFYTHGEKAEMISGVKGAKGAYTYPTAHLWPYKLIHHMFSSALSSHQNVSLYTHTPVLEISSSNTPPQEGAARKEEVIHTVQTPRGTLKTRTLILATNAYTAALLPEYESKIIPYRTVCSRITVPPSHLPTLPLLSSSYALRFNELDFDYLIPRTDGSIIVGGARRMYLGSLGEWYENVDDGKIIEGAGGYFEGYMQRLFRGWEGSGAEVGEVWSGVMGYSSDLFPRIGQVPGRQNMFIMGGFTGHGMPQIFLAAKALSDMVLKRTPVEETGIPRLFRESKERLESKENLVLDMYRRYKGKEAKL